MHLFKLEWLGHYCHLINWLWGLTLICGSLSDERFLETMFLLYDIYFTFTLVADLFAKSLKIIEDKNFFYSSIQIFCFELCSYCIVVILCSCNILWSNLRDSGNTVIVWQLDFPRTWAFHLKLQMYAHFFRKTMSVIHQIKDWRVGYLVLQSKSIFAQVQWVSSMISALHWSFFFFNKLSLPWCFIQLSLNWNDDDI